MNPEIRISAGCQPAIRQAASLRYVDNPKSESERKNWDCLEIPWGLRVWRDREGNYHHPPLGNMKGLTHRDEFGKWLTAEGLVGVGVEVGVYYGENAAQILESWPGRLWGVDPYKKFPLEEYRDGCNEADLEKALESCRELLGRFGQRFTLMRLTSVAAAPKFADGSLDFVYTDANHRYESQLEDCRVWWPKVKRGGVLGGHDFYKRDDEAQLADVPRAVNEFAEFHGLPVKVTECTSWWIRKI